MNTRQVFFFLQEEPFARVNKNTKTTAATNAGAAVLMKRVYELAGVCVWLCVFVCVCRCVCVCVLCVCVCVHVYVSVCVCVFGV